jgi:NAD-dependent deacetylase
VNYQEKIQLLAELLEKSTCTFALTGAGISTESGIPDFRSPGSGLWSKHDPAEVASVSAFMRNPAAFYELNMQWWNEYLFNAEPGPTHLALARLEKKRLLAGVITQNIDGLHQKAGSQKVYEVHGHLRTCHCISCNASHPFAFLVSQFDSGQNPPRCERCHGVLRPDVVLFEDPLGEDFFYANRDLTRCRLLIAIGSSLQVYPVAALPEKVRQLVIINRDATPWDGEAELVINNEQAGKVLTDTLSVLGKNKT